MATRTTEKLVVALGVPMPRELYDLLVERGQAMGGSARDAARAILAAGVGFDLHWEKKPQARKYASDAERKAAAAARRKVKKDRINAALKLLDAQEKNGKK